MYYVLTQLINLLNNITFKDRWSWYPGPGSRPANEKQCHPEFHTGQIPSKPSAYSSHYNRLDNIHYRLFWVLWSRKGKHVYVNNGMYFLS